MKILIPTAKEMNIDHPCIEALPLREESQVVLDSLAHYSASELESFYKVSAEKAEEEYAHIQALKDHRAKNYPALKLFDGLMYRHIKRDGLTEAEQTYLENHVLITSALYGVVPALSSINLKVTIFSLISFENTVSNSDDRSENIKSSPCRASS